MQPPPFLHESAEFHAVLELKTGCFGLKSILILQVFCQHVACWFWNSLKGRVYLEGGEASLSWTSFFPALCQLDLYQDSGMAPPTQRSNLSFLCTHSFSTCVSVSTMCQVPCYRLVFRNTSLYLVSVHGTLYHFSPPEQIWCTSMQTNGMFHSDHLVIRTRLPANVHRAQKLERWRNIF